MYIFLFYILIYLEVVHVWNNVSLVSVLGRVEGYTVKYTPPSEGVPEGEA